MIQGSSDIQAQRALASWSTTRTDELQNRLEGRGAEAGEKFEAYFATVLVKELRKSLPKGFFQGAGSDVYGAWFDQHLGESLRRGDALGIAGLIKSSLPPQEEPAPARAADSNEEELALSDNRRNEQS